MIETEEGLIVPVKPSPICRENENRVSFHAQNPPPSLPKPLSPECRVLIGSHAFEENPNCLTMGERPKNKWPMSYKSPVRIPWICSWLARQRVELDSGGWLNLGVMSWVWVQTFNLLSHSDGYTIGANAGKYATVTFKKAWKRRPDWTQKDILLNWFKCESTYLHPYLKLNVGLEVSTCTGNATRTSLWNALCLDLWTPTMGWSLATIPLGMLDALIIAGIVSPAYCWHTTHHSHHLLPHHLTELR